MKIGVISDTHRKVGKTKKALSMLIENGAEFIVHAGDIVEPDILELLKNSGLNYVAVYGNNDSHLLKYQNDYNLVKEPYYFKIAHTKFKLMHLPYYMNADTDVVIFGHTHIFLSEYKENTLFLNSGEVCARKKSLSECAMLEVTKNSFNVTHYSRESGQTNFKSEEFNYKREK